MKRRMLSVALALCLLIPSQSAVLAEEEAALPQKGVTLSMEEDVILPSEEEVQPSEEVTEPGEEILSQEEEIEPGEGIQPSEEAAEPGEEIRPSEETAEPGEEIQPSEEVTEPGEGIQPSEEVTEPGEGIQPSEEVAEPDEGIQSPEEETDPGEEIQPSEEAAEPGEGIRPSEETAEGETELSEETALQQCEVPLQPRGISENESVSMQAVSADSAVPAPTQVYEAMIALKNQEAYKEGTPWNDYEPYSDSKGYYYWNGGLIEGKRIAAVGCVAFAFILSDAAFGSLPNRMYTQGNFKYEDIKVGDILRVNNDTHTVIVLEVNDAGVVVAEGNISTGDHQGKVHWGRTISKEEVMSNTSHYITRYPEGYVAPDDPAANEIIGSGTFGTGLSWSLTKAGTLTISGSGAMPDFSAVSEQPWNTYGSQIRTVIIEEGITSIGACAFWKCGVLSVSIPSSVAAIGNHAFRESSIISVDIPSGVKTIGNDAFNKCVNLSSVTVSEGLESIGERAFQSCTSLKSIALPASIGEVGAGAFWQCSALVGATFASGSKQVKLGDNLFTQCYYLMNVKLPQSIERIGEGMFQNCLMLPGVEIPQGAESIGGSAFASSGVSVVVIPDSVTSIGIAAFSSTHLKDIYFTGTEAQWNSISKIGDTAAAVAKATIHYEYKPSPSPTTEPSQSPSPTTEPSQSTSPTTEPSQSPSPTAEPSQSPSPTTEPSQSPSPTAKPSQSPSPTAEPSQSTSPTAEPGQSLSPTAEPSQSPSPTAEPSQSPIPTAEPSQSPSPTIDPGQTPAPTSVPDTGIPAIRGEAGKAGWEAIKEEAIKEETVDTSEEKQINVDMNGASVVPGDVLDSVKGQNVTFSFAMGNGVTWRVNGRNVTAEHTGNVDLSVQVGTSDIPDNLVKQTAEERPLTQLSLAHSGDFGFSAVLMIDMDSTNAGKYANLFYYNENENRLEFVIADRIDEDGTAELTFTHASDYIIVVDDTVMNGSSHEGGDSSGSADESGSGDKNTSKEAEIQSPKTGEIDTVIGGDDSNEFRQEGSGLKLLQLLLMSAVGIAAVGVIICLIQMKVNKKD